MNECAYILNKIIKKGGLMGIAAGLYINDDEKAKQFIFECFEQCHNASAIRLWGADLTNEIKKYCHNNSVYNT
jgi:hypothetical protein